jgi:putative transposase
VEPGDRSHVRPPDVSSYKRAGGRPPHVGAYKLPVKASPSNPTPHDSRPGRLPRLPREYYQGDAMVHWTLPTLDRARGWLSDGFHARFRELMLHAAAREGLLCPAYCLMSDHMHLVWMGLRPDTDQRNGMVFLRTYLEPTLAPVRYQPQAHDSVLREAEREHEAFAKVCAYIVANPVRAGLVTKPEKWRFTGAVVPGYPTLHPLKADFWKKLWSLYSIALHPDAGRIKRPRF